MQSRNTCLTVVMSLLLCSVASAQPYLFSLTTHNQLVRIDGATGSVTPMGPISFSLGDPSLTMTSDGRLWCLNQHSLVVTLYELDPSTGAVLSATLVNHFAESVTSVGTQLKIGVDLDGDVNAESLADLAFDGTVSNGFNTGVDLDGLGSAADGTIYSLDTAGGNQVADYYRLVPGPTALVASTTHSPAHHVRDLTVVDGEIWGVATNISALERVDIATGALLARVALPTTGEVYVGLTTAPTPTVDVGGIVSSGCGEGSLGSVVVTLSDLAGNPLGNASTAADGSYSFDGIEISLGSVIVSVASPAGFESVAAETVSLDGSAANISLPCVYVAVSGSVASDCAGFVEGVAVTLTDASGSTNTSTATDGSYGFVDIRLSEATGQVEIAVPEGFTAGSPPTGTQSVDLTSSQPGVDFTLICDAGPVSISGTVSSDCPGPLANVTVDLVDATGELFIAVTDASGAYSFEDVAASDDPGAGEVSISIPLGFEATSPPDGEAAITLDENRVVDFTLACLDPTGSARSKGYWKHNANVYLRNRGNGQESEADMETNYPAAVFDHFHENELNGIAVEGVTYRDEGSGPEPVDLATIAATLSVKGNAGMLAKAKQQYLAVLLNVASGKLPTFAVVSADERTASQALQYVADCINDGDPSNDEIAKDIGDDVNNAKLVPAGVIPEGYTTIYYARPAVEDRPLSIFPNPGGPSKDYTLSFAVPVSGRASLEVFDVAGRRVATVLSGDMPAGPRKITWAGRDSSGRVIGQGVYFVRLTTALGTKTAKLVHLGR